MLTKDHWEQRALDYLVPHLANTQSHVRISTGFFTIQGYKLLRKHLVGKMVYIMVGYDEMSKERLREQLVEDIMRHLRQWDEENRREAVLDLVSKLQRGELQVVERGKTEFIDARIRKYDHAKVFIFDDALVGVGSSNLTFSGLINNVEGIATVDEQERVQEWVRQFDEYWNASDTYDLTAELLDILLQWLELRVPYDVYLRAIQALVPEDDIEAPRDTYKMPVKYQQVVVERMLRQLEQYGGAMVVASTGLGKTIMATHAAYRLQQAEKIRNVIVFAPKPTYGAWEETLDSAGLSYKVFTRDLLDQPSTKRTKKVNEILTVLDRVDSQYLIIVDESHHFRNHERPRDGKPRYAYRRLSEITAERKPYVILLTATPFAKSIEDLNHQLLYLPHTGPRRNTDDKGQFVMEGFENMLLNPTAWHVQDGEDFFDDFINLPVCTVISTSQVARDFATHTECQDRFGIPQNDQVENPQNRRSK